MYTYLHSSCKRVD